MSVADAAASGDELALLRAMRTRLAAAIDDERTHPRDLAALTRRLADTAAKIATLEERLAQEGGSLDEDVGNDDWTPEDL